MVFTCVEIWRGVIIEKTKLIESMKNIYGDDEVKEDEEIYNIIDNLNNYLHNWHDKKFKFVNLAPCCGDHDTVILGIQLTEYDRPRFDWADVKEENREFVEKIKAEHENYRWGGRCCGQLLKEEKDTQKLSNRCGYYYCCDECLNSTLNGSYPVDDILNKVSECTTYCFKCNQDRCGKEHKVEGNPGFPLTSDYFIDKLLKESLEECELDNKDVQIKNYYRLDDCLSCT